MADVSFEHRLLRAFDEPPAFADADLFASRVEARLDRGWGLRQLLIGTLGIVGGMIGTVQVVGSGFVPQLEAASAQSRGMLTERMDDLWRSSFELGAMPLGSEVLWMAAALGVMALAFAVTRAVEEF